MPTLSFFFNDTATTEIYSLSLHDALPISNRCRSIPPWSCSASRRRRRRGRRSATRVCSAPACSPRTRSTSAARSHRARSEEHTSELQSRQYLVCRLLLEKKLLSSIQSDQH